MPAHQAPPAASTPAGELRRRAAALRGHLGASQLDAAIITQNADLFYFAGSIQSGVLIVPARGEPVYAVRRILERARAESTLDTIVPLPGLRSLAPLLAEACGRPPRRIGMELDVLPVSVRDRFAASLGAAELADVSAAVRRVRSLKSPYELDKLRAAARLSDAILGAATEALREGMTELELSSSVEAAARRRTRYSCSACQPSAVSIRVRCGFAAAGTIVTFTPTASQQRRATSPRSSPPASQAVRSRLSAMSRSPIRNQPSSPSASTHAVVSPRRPQPSSSSNSPATAW